MPWASITLTPGVRTDITLSANEAGVASSSNIRWHQGMPQKKGGWQKFVQTQFPGDFRALHAWQDVNGHQWLAAATVPPAGSSTGTSLKAITNGTIYDLTPATIVRSSLAMNFNTTIGSNVVTINDTGSNLTVYDVVMFNTPVSVGGICLYGMYPVASATANSYTIVGPNNATANVTNGGAVVNYSVTSGSATVTASLNGHPFVVGGYYPAVVSSTLGGVTIYGLYQVLTVPDANTFTFQASLKATSSVAGYVNGGNANVVYYLASGAPIYGTAFGADEFGVATNASYVSYFGLGVAQTPVPAAGSNIVASDWMIDNWGELLVANAAGGPIYIWSPETVQQTVQPIPTAPPAANGILMAMPQQQLFAWGATYNLVSDPLQIRWSDVGNYAQWTPMAITQAGGYRIPTGSRIVSMGQVNQQLMIWTDVDVYAAQYVGQPYIWGFNKLASGCGLVGPHAWATQSQTAFWMSQRQFFISDSNGVNPLPCAVWDAVFQNIRTDLLSQVVAASNAMFNEVTWFYPSAASTGENDSYVTYNVAEQVWDIGSLARNAWVDQSVLGGPIGGAPDGYLYQHESGYDADGAPMVASLSSGYFSLSEGGDFLFIDQVIADAKWQTYSDQQNAAGAIVGSYIENEGGELTFRFNVADFPGDSPRTYGPFVVNQRVQFLPVRFRGRLVQMVVSSGDKGTFWRLSPKIRFRYAPDGKR